MKKLLAAIGIFLLASTINAPKVTATPITPTSILLPNGVQGTILATNNPGDVVGTFVPPGIPFPEFLGFEIDHHSVFTEIGPSFPPLTLGGIRHSAIAIDINNSGDVVGLWRPFLSGEPGIFQSFLFEKDVYTNIEIDIPDSVPHCLDHQTVATSISNSGDVFGGFRVGDVASPCFPGGTIAGSFVWRNGIFFTDAVPGFTFIKVPEPAAWWLLGFGLIAMVRVGRRIV